MSEQPPYPQDPNHPPSGSTPPPPPPPGGYGTPPPPPPGGYGAPPPPGGYGSPPPPPAPGGYGGPPAGPSYDVIEAVKYGWQKFTANWGAFVVIALLAVAVPGVISLIGSGFSSGGSGVFSEPDASGRQMAFGGGLSLVGALFSIASQVVSVFFTAAMVRAGLDATEGRAVDVSSAFTRWSFLQVLLLALIVGVGTFVGILLCVIPGLVFIFFTWFGNYFVVGRGESGPSAVRSSMQFTAANIGSLLLLMLVSVLVVIAGALACLVGLLVAIPVITIAAAYTFKVLQGEPVAP